ncbi:MAG: GNAT family N-acetyltransferase, partial [Gemmatimonadetes bacterium]|nr:GNAT family N-acetyltransferase [Gemmatimonadota bacterium]
MTTATGPATDPPFLTDARFTIRPVETRAEYESCVELQRETWGRSFSDVVPVSMMGIAVKMGGICLGAFDRSGELLGFVFGVTGPKDGETAHWSHMLAVRGEARNAGIGRQLKMAQRAALAEQGVETVYWTFDPLVARNAHFNLNRLGATIAEFVPDMYGASDSDLHRLGTDRFVARWSLSGGT